MELIVGVVILLIIIIIILFFVLKISNKKDGEIENNITVVSEEKTPNLFPLIQIIIPIGLIIYGTIDLGKAVIASDEKEVKAAQSRLIKRFIYAALIFFVVTLVSALMSIIATGGEGDTNSWSDCWRAAA